MTRRIHVKEVVVEGLPRSGICAVWHIPVIPVVDVLHDLALIWRMTLIP
jgi:hypothetical protein